MRKRYASQHPVHHLRSDPHCIHNLWDDAAAAGRLKEKLLDRLILLMAENVDPLPPRVGAC